MAAKDHPVGERGFLRNKDLWDERSLLKIAVTALWLFSFLKLFYSTFYVPGTVLSVSFTHINPLRQTLLSAHSNDKETGGQNY